MAYPANYRYTKEHEWVDVKGDVAAIGITDYAQHELGDVVFVELPKVGAKIEAGKTFGTVESVKAVSDIYAPVSGEVVEANGDLQNTPEKINSDPHGAGWLIKMRLANPAEISPYGRRGLRGLHRRAKQGSLCLMRYLPKSPAERQDMLAAIGAKSIDELFSSIPERFRLREALHLPGPLSETEIIEFFKARAAENSGGYTSFLGAGVYNHLRSVVTDAIIQRGEFLTSYTPYQAEIAQGTLQAIFEFQTLMCQLTGQEVANASMYDGSTADDRSRADGRAPDRAAAACLWRARLHPEYRDVLKTYAKNSGLHVEEIRLCGARARWIRKRCMPRSRTMSQRSSCNRRIFSASSSRSPPLADAAHAAGALLVTAITEGVSLGLVRPPAEADIVAMEGQSFGLAPSYGGPFAGVIASRDKFVRQMPGRLTGQTTDSEGRRGFVLTLATREQHIRREKATSNICTNQALCALAATVHLTLLGKEGLREMADQNLSKAQIRSCRTRENSGRTPRI